MSLYNNLTEYLNRQDKERVVITFEKLAQIIGEDTLANSYYTHPGMGFAKNKPITKAVEAAEYEMEDYNYEDKNNYFIVIRKGSNNKMIVDDTLDIDQNLSESIVIDEDITVDTTRYNELIALTRENADIIEDKITHDPKYKPRAFNKYTQYKNNGQWGDKASLLDVAKQIRTDNSTRTSNVNVEKIVDYMLDPTNNVNYRLSIGDKTLPDDLKSVVDPNVGKGPRSFASKICKYLNEFIYDRKDYYIYDKIVKTMLPQYLNGYGVPNNLWKNKNIEKISYAEYWCLLDLVHTKRNEIHGQEINNSELDHIIWYSYK